MEIPEDYFNGYAPYPETMEEVREGALDGSDYVNRDRSPMMNIIDRYFIGVGILTFVVAMVIIVYLSKQNHYGKTRNLPMESDKNIPYYYQFPFHNNMELGFYANQLYETSGFLSYANIIDAYLLKWIRLRYVEVVQENGLSKDRIRMLIPALPSECTNFEQELYGLLQKASNVEQILAKNELKKWAKDNRVVIWEVLGNFNDRVELEFTRQGYITQQDNVVEKQMVTSQGRSELVTLLGFKNYLLDKLLHEDYVDDLSQFDDYFIWCELLGLWDDIDEQIELFEINYHGSIVLENRMLTREMGKMIGSVSDR